MGIAVPGWASDSSWSKRRFTTFFLLSLVAIYAASRFFQVFPDRLPMPAIVALHVVPALLFALIHGRMLYGLRGILMFFAICAAVGGTVENIGVATGFPFGRYYFTDLMGPKVFYVPIFLGLAYLGMGYLSWLVAALILGWERQPLSGRRVVILPLFAAIVMTSWDLCMDPVWSTLVHAWIWRDGGAYFGVPLSNFVGWILNVYVIYQLFALWLRKRAAPTAAMPPQFWGIALLFYAVSAAGNFLLLIPHPGITQAVDPTGRVWLVQTVAVACALTTAFTMGTFTLLAGIRIDERYSQAT